MFGSLKAKSLTKSEGKGELSRLTEADLPTLVRMAVKDGMPGDNKLTFAFEDEEDVHVRIVSRRILEDDRKAKRSWRKTRETKARPWTSGDGGDVLGTPMKNEVTGKVRTTVGPGRANVNKVPEMYDDEDGRSVDVLTPAEEHRLRKSVKPRRWDTRLEEEYKCNGRVFLVNRKPSPSRPRSSCLKFVCDLEGEGMREAYASIRWSAKDKVQGQKPTVLRFIQAQRGVNK